MKCKNCCFYIILNPERDSKFVCVRNPPVIIIVNTSGPTRFPSPNPNWWCGEWKPKDFIKAWPENLTDEF